MLRPAFQIASLRARGASLLAFATMLSLAGCSAEPNGPQLIAAASQHRQAALAARHAACGSDASLPPQSLQPRMPEQDTPACREASFEYEKAALDLSMTQHRFAQTPAGDPSAAAAPAAH